MTYAANNGATSKEQINMNKIDKIHQKNVVAQQ